MKEKVLSLIGAAIDEVNMQLSPEHQLGKSSDTVIFAHGSGLDSLGLVNFIVAVEQKLQEELKTEIVLSDERIMNQSKNPLENIDSLVEYILMLLEEKQGG